MSYCKRERETQRHSEWKREKESKIERVSEKGRETQRERKGGAGGGIFMDVVSEIVEMLHLLWTSIQWKEHDGKSASAVTGLLYKSWGVTPTLCWLQTLMSVCLCWTFKPFSLVSSPFTTGNAVQFPFLPLCSYLNAYRPCTPRRCTRHRACMTEHKDILQWCCCCSGMLLLGRWFFLTNNFAC